MCDGLVTLVDLVETLRMDHWLFKVVEGVRADEPGLVLHGV